MEKKIKIKEYLGTESVNPLLTDFYQFTMLYAYWKNGRSTDTAVFDLYFRKSPFNMKFCVFGGVDECFEYLSNFKFTKEHVNYLRKQLPQADEEFFTYLSNMDMSDVKVYGFNNAEFVLPNEPLMTLEGPLCKIQIIETTLLNLTNYPSLISSLAIRLRLSSQFKDKILLEDGSICAQSPCGAVMGVKYSVVGGVDQTSNLIASKLFDLDLMIKTPKIDDEIELESLLLNDYDFLLNDKNLLILIESKLNQEEYIKLKSKIMKILYPAILNFKSKIFTFEINNKNNLNEDILLFSLISDTLREIDALHKIILIINYLEAIDEIKEIKNILDKNNYAKNTQLIIRYNPSMLKNDYEEVSPLFDGILLGPEFIVSYTQPALGMVYKLNQINQTPTMKFSEEKDKQTIPGSKVIIRHFSEKGEAIGDFMCLREESDNYLNMKETEAYNWNQFTEKSIIKSYTSRIMNNLLFENGKVVTPNLLNVKELKNKILEDVQFYHNQPLHLFISEGIRNIILEATHKIEEIEEN